MKHFQSVDERIDLSHETLHEDDFTKADAHVTQLGREALFQDK